MQEIEPNEGQSMFPGDEIKQDFTADTSNDDGPEVKITAREFDIYLFSMGLERDSLEGRGIIVDVGSGFSEFPDIVNEQYSETGTRAVGVDPIYAFLGGDYDEFKERIESLNQTVCFDYGPVEKEEKAFRSYYDNFRSKAEKSQSRVAGSHQNLPFGNESVDLVMANNSVFVVMDSETAATATNEISRVLKEGGEARFDPTNFCWDRKNDQVLLVDTSEFYKEREEDPSKDDLKPDKKLFELFHGLEGKGLKIYAVMKAMGSKESFVPWLTIIIKKGDEQPDVRFRSEMDVELRRLNFGQSTDGYNIPSETVKKRDSLI